jgi:hypothetical protein
MMSCTLKDVMAWIDDVASDDDGIPLWRGAGALILDDVVTFTFDVAYLEDDIMLA